MIVCGPLATFSVLVENEQLPLPDNSVDRVLAVHCLETADRARPLLREMWRTASSLELLPVGIWMR